jgi:hypothetical protein
MPVVPTRLHGISTDKVKPGKSETIFRIFHIRPGNITEHVGFPAAGGAGAGTAKQLEVKVRLLAVVPPNGQLVSDLLNISRLQTHASQRLSEQSTLEQSFSHRLPCLPFYLSGALRHCHKKRCEALKVSGYAAFI